jgi:hypothetical protein
MTAPAGQGSAIGGDERPAASHPSWDEAGQEAGTPGDQGRCGGHPP